MKKKELRAESREQGGNSLTHPPTHSPTHSLTHSLTESEGRQLMLRLEELACIEGLRDEHPSRVTRDALREKADDSEVYKRDGSVVLEGPFIFKELSADPDDPEEGQAVMWMSDGTGSGDDGDIMMKISAGGVTKITTLVDFSAM